MTVAVICFNGEATLKRTLDSLLAVDYPRSRFEIILVDDGSTDNTGKIARSYKKTVKYVRLSKNQGVSGARNAGLKAAKGEIYVGFDADCVVEKDWLRELAKGYKLENAVGVGGYLDEIEDGNASGILRQYIGVQGKGFPPAISKVTTQEKKSPLKRLWNYLVAGAHRHKEVEKAHIEVAELYGANASFPVKVLRAVGGYSTSMSGVEDRDISTRIRKKFPDGHFYAMKNAVIRHDPAMSWKQFLLRPYKRGPVNFRFHIENHITPPIFPFPFVFLLLTVATALLKYQFLPVVLLFLPQLLYFWWSNFPAGQQKVVYLAFPYIQLSEETMVMVGLLRGYMLTTHNPFLTAVRNVLRWSTLTPLLVTAVWMFLVMNDGGSRFKIGFSALFLALMPGYYAFRALVGYHLEESKMKIVSYALGLSVVMLMFIGLAINQFAPMLTNNQAPLSVRHLAWAIGAVTIGLIVVASGRKRVQQKPRTLASFYTAALRAAPVLLVSSVLPVLAIGGAITLNNGGSNWLALTTIGLAALLFIVLVWKKTGVVRYYPAALYGISLAILLGTSMRGWNITGHDVMQEYQVFQLTLQHSAWHMSYYQDAYNACLSITILPTIFQKLTGISDPYVYKFLYQLMFAMIAPIMYFTLRDYVPRRTALLAAFLFITFPTFLTDMTMLNRQEIAILCLALSLQVGLDRLLPPLAKRTFMLLFIVGVVLSHYSTSYITLGVLFVTLLLSVLYGPFAKQFQKRKSIKKVTAKVARGFATEKRIYTPAIIIVASVSIYVWGTPITHTSGNIAQTLTGFAKSVPTLFHKTNAPKPTGTEMDQYLAFVTKNRAFPTNDYYTNAITSTSSVVTTPQATNSETSLLKKLHVPVSVLSSAYDLSRTLYAGFTELLIAVGLILLLIGKVRTKLPRQYILLGCASLLIIGVQVVAPSGVIDYGILRVIQQSLLFLALPIILACFWILGKARVPVLWQTRIVGVMLVLFFLILSGFIPTLTGGYKPVLALNNSGLYYEAYYTHQDEIVADQWLVMNSPKGSRVYADEFARRKMVTYSGSNIFAQPILVPQGIPIDSYVYLSNANTTFNDVPLYYNGDVLSHTVPYAFLNANKNILYNSGQVIIYK